MYKSNGINSYGNSVDIKYIKNNMFEIMEQIDNCLHKIRIDNNQEMIDSYKLIEKYKDINKLIKNNLNTLDISPKKNEQHSFPITINNQNIDDDSYFTNYIYISKNQIEKLNKLKEITYAIKEVNKSEALDALIEIVEFLNSEKVNLAFEKLIEYNEDLQEKYNEPESILGGNFSFSVDFLNLVLNNKSSLETNIMDFNVLLNTYDLNLKRYKEEEYLGIKSFDYTTVGTIEIGTSEFIVPSSNDNVYNVYGEIEKLGNISTLEYFDTTEVQYVTSIVETINNILNEMSDYINILKYFTINSNDVTSILSKGPISSNELILIKENLHYVEGNKSILDVLQILNLIEQSGLSLDDEKKIREIFNYLFGKNPDEIRNIIHGESGLNFITSLLKLLEEYNIVDLISGDPSMLDALMQHPEVLLNDFESMNEAELYRFIAEEMIYHIFDPHFNEYNYEFIYGILEGIFRDKGLDFEMEPNPNSIPKPTYSDYYREYISGLQAMSFIINGELIIAYEGSQTDGLNWATDWAIANGIQQVDLNKIPTQYEDALSFAKEMEKKYEGKYSNIVLTGHSLGGGAAQYAASRLDFNSIVFDPAPSPVKEGYSKGIEIIPSDSPMNIAYTDDKYGRTYSRMFVHHYVSKYNDIPYNPTKISSYSHEILSNFHGIPVLDFYDNKFVEPSSDLDKYLEGLEDKETVNNNISTFHSENSPKHINKDGVFLTEKQVEHIEDNTIPYDEKNDDGKDYTENSNHQIGEVDHPTSEYIDNLYMK